MTGDPATGDFRMLIVVRAAMKPTSVAVAESFMLVPEKKRRGLRRVLREFARPFERLGKAFRRGISAILRRVRNIRPEQRSLSRTTARQVSSQSPHP
jgi:hypothetical protein